MKNKISILVIALGIFMPQIASAAWYDFINPFSWFREEKIEYQNENIDSQPDRASQSEVISPTPPTTEPEIIEKTVIKEVRVPVEKVVEKTVTVQDQTIVTENTTLKAKIKELESKYNQCSASLSKLQTIISQTEVQKEVLETKIKQIEGQIYTLNNFSYICTISSSGSSSCQNNVSEQESWSLVSQLEGKKSQLQLELSKL